MTIHHKSLHGEAAAATYRVVADIEQGFNNNDLKKLRQRLAGRLAVDQRRRPNCPSAHQPAAPGRGGGTRTQHRRNWGATAGTGPKPDYSDGVHRRCLCRGGIRARRSDSLARRPDHLECASGKDGIDQCSTRSQR